MHNIRRNWERFLLRNQSKGIRNLLLYVAIIKVAVYFFITMDPSGLMLQYLSFSPALILRGQVWRLVSYIFLPSSGRLIVFVISLFFYYYMGRMLESALGTLKLNLYFFSCILISDLFVILLSLTSPVVDLYAPGVITLFAELPLLLAFAAIYGDTRVLLFYIIPIRMKYLAWLELAYLIYYAICWPFPVKLLVIMPLIPFFLSLSKESRNLLPSAWQSSIRHKKRKKPAQSPNPDWAKNYRSKDGQKPYHHKCTVCGRTDTDYPELEFRYCSQCKGYYCYCTDHINNHVHITE